MANPIISGDSFLFRGIDVLKTFGIRMTAADLLYPKQRQRKVIIPSRSGAYEFPGQYHDERVLSLQCDTRIGLTRSQIREAAILFQTRSQIRLWDEPDKYYMGRIYDDTPLQRISRDIWEFTLDFICDPYAYGEIVDEPLNTRFDGATRYKGTAQTPTRITIRNTGSTPVSGLTIRVRRRKQNSDPTDPFV